jgi:uracil-DNA glycosylase
VGGTKYALRTMCFQLASIWRCRDSWGQLNQEFDASYMEALDQFLDSERGRFYPREDEIFKAFEATALDNVKVVIVGQDPYHDGKATGLAFSVRNRSELSRTPSLRNIYKAIEADLRSPSARSGDLTPWAEDGVLLLNAILTVRHHEPGSHSSWGWKRFTDRVIKVISEERDGVIFLLWGQQAWSKAPLVHTKRHYFLPAAHPQARPDARLSLSRCRHFSLTNHLLEAQKREPIRWWRA